MIVWIGMFNGMLGWIGGYCWLVGLFFGKLHIFSILIQGMRWMDGWMDGW